jgi:hypothetical protein
MCDRSRSVVGTGASGAAWGETEREQRHRRQLPSSATARRRTGYRVRPPDRRGRHPVGVLKRIHVNQHVIRANRRDSKSDPPLTVKTHKSNTKAHEVSIDGPSRVIYSPDKPLACGAHVWIETTAAVDVVGPTGEATRLP